MKNIFEKSIVVKKDLSKFHKIRFEDLLFLKPGNGIRADRYKKIIGLRTNKKIKKYKFLRFSDLIKK